MLGFDGSLISYNSQHYGTFSLPLSRVALIGEFTTDNGPFVDDWFLVFDPQDDGVWFEASMYAEGVDAFREQLSKALSSPICGTLFASTSFASRILWPLPLIGEPLFTFGPAPASGFLHRLKRFFLPEVSRTLSPAALSATDAA